VKQGDYLIEAPLSFYAKPHRCAFFPGYEFGDYGSTAQSFPVVLCSSRLPPGA
jgi:hypothetical protein